MVIKDSAEHDAKNESNIWLW